MNYDPNTKTDMRVDDRDISGDIYGEFHWILNDFFFPNQG